jgi:hypothetical protein
MMTRFSRKGGGDASDQSRDADDFNPSSGADQSPGKGDTYRQPEPSMAKQRDRLRRRVFGRKKKEGQE